MYPNSRRVGLDYATDDRTLFSFFNAVYAWMAVGLAVTAVVAFLVSQSQAMLSIVYSGRGMVLAMALGAFGIAWYVQANFHRISVMAATCLFMLYAVVIGTMISGIFIMYPMATLLAAFLVTGGTFGAMSVYGFVTKRDLSRIGSILVMCAIGLFIASAVNIFLASDTFSWIITYAVLAVFIGITAYETQKLRNLALELQGNGAMLSRVAVVGSLVLYISFINLFLSILRILGNRR
jgi:FtsH-binding integral membrane protein